MLVLDIPETELYDETANVFYNTTQTQLYLEHSLLSASKWEAKYKRPFLNKEPMSREELRDYIRMMTLSTVTNDDVYYVLNAGYEKQILNYIDDPMTATTFRNEQNQHFNRQVITTELIYYWMVSLHIPFECEKWHLNRLLALIRVCSIKSAPQKKMSKGEILRKQHELNEKRKREYHTRG